MGKDCVAFMHLTRRKLLMRHVNSLSFDITEVVSETALGTISI
jgi:hypothetical protein